MGRLEADEVVSRHLRGTSCQIDCDCCALRLAPRADTPTPPPIVCRRQPLTCPVTLQPHPEYDRSAAAGSATRCEGEPDLERKPKFGRTRGESPQNQPAPRSCAKTLGTPPSRRYAPAPARCEYGSESGLIVSLLVGRLWADLESSSPPSNTDSGVSMLLAGARQCVAKSCWA